jgi:uncharacterized repeat protein (TIGR03837 family)
MRWDIFCRVIDNHGDFGVCWRLAADLAGRGAQVRLWADDTSMLAWMAPQGCPGVAVQPWSGPVEAEPGDVVVEAFGCRLDASFEAAIASAAQARGRPPAWINLEYLSAEPWVERCHGLPSPVMDGPAKGLAKRFFYPGYSDATGGLLREPGLLQARAAFDRASWLAARGLAWQGERLVSLFCYEPPGLPALLQALAADRRPTRLLATAGRASAALRAWLDAGGDPGPVAIDWLPLLPQPDYDRLLWACDLNCVRGEDSVVRALWAGAPLLWHVYPQDGEAHWPKLEAFLDTLGAPADLRAWHRTWVGGGTAPGPLALQAWQAALRPALQRLAAQPDLTSRLLAFVQAG